MGSVWIPYCGTAPRPEEILDRWNFDPALIVVLVLALAVVVARGALRRRTFALAAFALLVVGFVSPLCALSSALFSARTIHHILLVAVTAPLLVWSLPRLKAGSLAAATLVQTAVFWSWHAPTAYAWALSTDIAYWLMQLSLLGSALWFWTALRSASPLAATAALLVTVVQMGLLGAIITFAGDPLYAPHLAATATWGLTPLQDQQLAGVIMWAPAAALYLLAALIVMGRWLGPDQRAGARPA
jgi:putative membrane protein